MFNRDAFYLDGGWAAPTLKQRTTVFSPASEEPVGTVPIASPHDIDRAVASARTAFDTGAWRHAGLEERISVLLDMRERLLAGIDAAVELQIDEMGSPRSYMAGLTRTTYTTHIDRQIATARALPRRELREGIAGGVAVFRKPVGVVGAIIPWNGPITALMNKVLPALVSGCSIVVKPAPESPLSWYFVAEAAMAAGLPAGVLNIVPGDGEIGRHLVSHPGVDHVTFTGSSESGSLVAAECGALLRPVTLELGGKSAAILLDDVDIEQSMTALLRSSLPNNGQVCFATTRILIPNSRSEELTERIVSAVSELVVGDPHDERTDVGPLVSARQRDRVDHYVGLGKRQGARVAVGGGHPAHLDKGWFVDPTVFVGVDRSMAIAQDEIFGPVICLLEYTDESGAIALANDSAFGLGGAVFTADPDRGLRVASQIETGTCQVNGAPPGGGGGPFGGVKQSGIGRERDVEGLSSYFELSAVALPADFTPDWAAPSG